jgi:uncharacterized protein (DUF1501 family)
MSAITRRRFLRASLSAAPLLSLTPTVPLFVTRGAGAGARADNGRVLVIVELIGGNDGINTVVPFSDEGYAKNRRTLRLKASELLTLDRDLGLHPSLKPLARAWEDGRLAVVQGVSYPKPDRSHFVSRAIWYSARLGRERDQAIGWLGRGLDDAGDRVAPAVYVGDGVVPIAVRGQSRSCVSLGRVEDCRLAADFPKAGPAALNPSGKQDGDDLLAYARRTAMDAEATAHLFADSKLSSGGPSYPATLLGQRLQLVARAVKAGLKASTYYLVQGGGDPADLGSYDTHISQGGTHADLLAELAGAWSAMLTDLRESRLDRRVTLMAFSEFGRRVEENGSGGTDHGTAGPILLAGGSVKGGVLGTTPKLLDLVDGDLKWSLDFRRVYATLLAEWLGGTAERPLGGRFEHLPLFQGL